jgi:hypothetical protein
MTVSKGKVWLSAGGEQKACLCTPLYGVSNHRCLTKWRAQGLLCRLLHGADGVVLSAWQPLLVASPLLAPCFLTNHSDVGTPNPRRSPRTRPR